jgi:transposase
MFRPRKGKQTTFIYGPEIYDKLVDKNHFFYKINESVDFSFINENCRDLYSENVGRPVTNTPEIMFRSAIVQYLFDNSDREMEHDARFNIMVKWFIGLNLDDSSYDHSALGRFRDLLGEERWKYIFFNLLRQIENAGYVKGKEYVDATHVIANIAIPGTIDLLRQGIKDAMKAIQEIDPYLYEELGGEKTANDDKKVYKLSPEEKESKLVELVKKAREINQKSESIGGKVSEKTHQLKRILNENIEENENKIVKKKDKTPDRLVSIVDKDARHGAKSDEKKFTGYKVNSIMSEDGFIKNINATPGNSYDGDVLIPLIDEMVEKGFSASEVVGDTAYGEVDNRNKLLLKGITVTAPFKKETNRNELFPQSKFSIEIHGVTCPAGCRTMVWNHNEKTEKITFFFNKKDCGDCELKPKCTVQKNRTITISEHYELLKKAREYNKTDDFKEDMKQRAHIEPKQGEMKRYHGLQRAKYWGLSKVNIQATISAIVVNLKRFVTVIAVAIDKFHQNM